MLSAFTDFPQVELLIPRINVTRPGYGRTCASARPPLGRGGALGRHNRGPTRTAPQTGCDWRTRSRIGRCVRNWTVNRLPLLVLLTASTAPLRDRKKLCTTRSPCFDTGVTDSTEVPRVVHSARDIAAGADPIFELIADPCQQPRWDGNDNLVRAPAGQRVHGVGDVFAMTTTKGNVRENHVVEFEEGRRIAWLPSEPGQEPPGHLWRWELQPVDEAHTRVTHTYDWTRLTDEKRFARARATTADRLRASLNRLADLAEGRA